MSDSSDPPQAIAERGRSGTSVEVVPATERSMVRRLRMGEGVLCFLAFLLALCFALLPLFNFFFLYAVELATPRDWEPGTGGYWRGSGKKITLRCRRVGIRAAGERLGGRDGGEESES